MKKYYMMVIALGITLGVIAANNGPRLAEKQNENSKKVLEMYSSLTGQNEEDFVSDYDPEENAPDLEGEFEYYQEQSPQEDQESEPAPEVTDTTYLMVNDDVYHILKEAKLNFLHLYANGSIPTQMKNRGITLSQENYDYIDSNMHSAYTCICNYVDD